MNLQPIKTMLLGIMILLFGGFIYPADGLQILLLIIGLVIGIFGFFQKD